MKLENVKIGMKVVPHSKTVEAINWSIDFKQWLSAEQDASEFFIKNKFLYVVKFDNRGFFILGNERQLEDIDGDFFEASDFEPYVECPVQEEPQPVDLSEVKVGEKYVIGEIHYDWDSCFSYTGKRIIDRYYKAGDVVGILEDNDGDNCLSLNIGNGDFSYPVSVLFSNYALILYPYTEPSQAPQEESHLLLGVTPENENVISKPSLDAINYARKYYDNYIKVRKVYLEQFYALNRILCHTEDELDTLWVDSIGWTDDCVQEKLCNMLSIDHSANLPEELFNCFMEMVEFDVVIRKLKEGGFIK